MGGLKWVVMWIITVVLVFAAIEKRERDRDESVKDLAISTSITICRALNEIRVERNSQGDILKRFLVDAGRAREGSAKAGTDSKINTLAAHQFLEMSREIKPLQPIDCKRMAKNGGKS